MNTILEALRGDRKIQEIIFFRNVKPGNNISKIKEEAKQKGINYRFAEGHYLSSRAGKNHQGVIAVIEDYSYLDLEELLESLPSSGAHVILALDCIQDPGNLGAIIRTAECSGVSGLIIPTRRSARINYTVEKASAGALAYIPVAGVVNLNNGISKLKDRGYWIFGLTMAGATDYTEVDLTGPVCFVLGSEGKGLRPSIEKNCDSLLKIPLCGEIKSLNVSVACGVVLYERLRQKKEK